MSSSVFFKFKSQKEPTRVEFDGTTITVFELKRDIILKSGLGDGTDFDLAIYAEDGGEEYDDDTTLIPRSTTVVARRLPALKAGHGRAARYVSGKMPVHAKNSARREQPTKAPSKAPSTGLTQLSNAMTAEDETNAFFQMQAEQWSAQAEAMAHKTPVFKPGAKKPVNVPDHDPPQGYICYRCGEKGHWIQLCPTNDNPEFDNRPRVKRTTGIPKSFLRTVDKATALGQLGGDDDSKLPSGIMVNADGDYVVAEPDKAAWEEFQAKTKSSASAQKAASLDAKELEERGLLCPIDKKVFIEPMKTPCCGKTYCNDCITNALIESDFVCPNCATEGVLIDDLKSDDEAQAKLKEYVDEKAGQSGKAPGPESPAGAKSPAPADKDAEQLKLEEVKVETDASDRKSASPQPHVAKVATPKSPTDAAQDAKLATDAKEPADSAGGDADNSKKRAAEDAAENPKIPKAPKAMQQQQQQQEQQQQQQQQQQAAMMQQMMNGMNGLDGMNPMNPMNGMNGMPFGDGMNAMPGMNGFGNMMPFPGMPVMNNMPMGMPSMPNMGMNMNMGMMNPGLMNPGMMNPAMMGMPGGFNMGNNGMEGSMGGSFAGMAGGNNNNNGGAWPMGNGNGPVMNGGGMNGGGAYNSQGQNRRPNFAQPGNDEDNAYFRKPINPHRHQNRQRRVRPTDYRELGS